MAEKKDKDKNLDSKFGENGGIFGLGKLFKNKNRAKVSEALKLKKKKKKK